MKKLSRRFGVFVFGLVVVCAVIWGILAAFPRLLFGEKEPDEDDMAVEM